MNDLVSIIVPIYNVESYLERCLRSIINQTYKNIEILCIDDGSTDNSSIICESFKKEDLRIKVIHKENGGLSDARNVGLNNASGKWVLYVDSDDYIELDAVEKLLQCTDNQDIDIVVGVAKEIEDGKIVRYLNHKNLSNAKYQSKEYILKSIRNNEFYAPAWLNLYRKDFLLKEKLFYCKGLLYEDVELLPKLFLRASSVYYIDYPFYNYIKRLGSIMTNSKIEKSQFSAKYIIKEWYSTITQIEDVELRKTMISFFVRISLVFVGKYSIVDNIYPDNKSFFFYLVNSGNIETLIKSIIYGFSHKLYIKLYQKWVL